MPDNVLVYGPEVRAAARAAGVHPGDVEPCGDCGALAAPTHPGCPVRAGDPFAARYFVGSFSPTKKFSQRGKMFSWHRLRRGWRVYLDRQLNWDTRWIPGKDRVLFETKTTVVVSTPEEGIIVQKHVMPSGDGFDVWAFHAPEKFRLGAGAELVAPDVIAFSAIVRPIRFPPRG